MAVHSVCLGALVIQRRTSRLRSMPAVCRAALVHASCLEAARKDETLRSGANKRAQRSRYDRAIAQVNPNPRSARLFGLEGDAAAVGFDDLTRDRQTKASAVAFGGEERFE